MCGHKFRRVASFVKSLQEQQSLILSTAPFHFEIDDEGNHFASRFLACFSF